jgi:hypothetical protein
VLDAITLLLDSGADIRAFNDAGATALHLAVEGGSDAVVKLLAERGADLNLEDKSGRTPLDIAMGASPGGFTGRRGPAPGRVRESTAELLKGLGAKTAAEVAGK